ncbi:MAG: hypothetical protein ABI810_18630 [Sphingomonas bacterium]
MIDSAQDRHSQGFSVGRVFSRAFGTIAANPLATLGIVLLFGVVPAFSYGYVMRSLPYSLSPLSPVSVAKLLAAWIMAPVLTALITGGFVRLASAHDVGRRAGFAEAAGAGARALLPLIALGLVIGVSITIGVVALVVPGVLLAILWVVAAPVLVEERCDIFTTLGRSRELTKGVRGPIFGILAVVFAVTTGTTYLVTTMVARSYLGDGPPVFSPLANQFVFAAMGAITRFATAAINSSIYVELRNWKHGTSEDELAEIFA